jgi:hypothetical protein
VEQCATFVPQHNCPPWSDPACQRGAHNVRAQAAHGAPISGVRYESTSSDVPICAQRPARSGDVRYARSVRIAQAPIGSSLPISAHAAGEQQWSSK